MRSVNSFLAAAATAFVCWCVGRALLSQLRLRLTRLESWAFSFLMGSAVVSLLMLALGLAGGLGQTSFVLLGALAFLGWRKVPTLALPGEPSLAWSVNWAFWMLFALFGGVYTVVALAPEISPDGLTYHLPLVQRYLRDGAIRAIPTDLYAQLSQGLEMLFLPAYAFGQHSAAALIHLSFLLLLPLLMLAYGLRQGNTASAAAAALLVFLSPVVGADGSAAYNDVALAAVAFGTFFALERWRAEKAPDWLIVAGLLAGFAFGIKYTAVFLMPGALAAILWRHAPIRESLPHALRFLLPALVTILAWLLKNHALVGNPLSPFFNTWFPNNVMDWPLEREYFRAVENYRGYTSAWWIPWEVTVLGETLQGLIGPVFLLLPLALLSLRHAEGRRLWAAAATMLLPFAFNHGTRFLIPALPFLALALTGSLRSRPFLLAFIVAFHGLTSWPTAIPLYSAPYAWRIREIPWAAAFGAEAPTDFLRRHLPDFPVLEALNQVVQPGEPVAAFRNYAASYTAADLWIDNRSRAAAELCRLIYVPVIEAQHPTAGERFWFPAAPLTGIRVAKPPGSILMVSEIRLFDLMDPVQLAEPPQVSAHPPRDDAAFSFDGNRLTRWRGGQNPNRASSLEINWRTARSLSRVDIEHRPIHPAPALILTGRLSNGEWRLLTDHSEALLAGPLPQARTAVTRELLRRGVRFVLVHDQDVIAADVRQNLEAWHWRVLRAHGSITLYQLRSPDPTSTDNPNQLPPIIRSR